MAESLSEKEHLEQTPLNPLACLLWDSWPQLYQPVLMDSSLKKGEGAGRVATKVETGLLASRNREEMTSLTFEAQAALIGVLSPTDLNTFTEEATGPSKSVDLVELERRLALLCQRDWLDVIDARSDQLNCGWPLCAACIAAKANNTITSLIQRERDKQSKLPEALRLSHFCSKKCQSHARMVHRLLPEDPWWMRLNLTAAASLPQNLIPGPLFLHWLHVESEQPKDTTILGHASEIKIVEHVHGSPVASVSPIVGGIEGYTPRYVPMTAKQASVQKSEEKEEDADIAALFKGRLPRTATPTLSPFGMIFTTLDAWITPQSIEYLKQGERHAAQSQQNPPERTKSIHLPVIDGSDAANARRDVNWALLKRKTEAMIPEILAGKGEALSFSVDLTALLKDIQNLFFTFSFEREPLPLASKHWKSLAFVTLCAVAQAWHPLLFAELRHSPPSQSYLTPSQLDSLLSLFFPESG